MSEWSEAEQRVARAREFFERGQWKAALSELRAAIDINPYNASWHVNLGLTLDEMGRHDEAIAAYRDAIELEVDVHTLMFLGTDLHRIGRHREALDAFERCQQLDPSFEPSYCHRIHVYAELGQHEQAEEMFYLARLFKDQCPQCYDNMGVSLAARGLHDRAIACWQRALDLDGDLHGVHQRIARAYWIRGDLERSRRHYLQALHGQPTYIPVLIELGQLLLDMQSIEDAGAKFRHAAELSPDDPAAQYHFGWFHARHGQSGLAFEALARCLRLDPTYPAAHLRLAELYHKLSQPEPARHHTKAELALRPGDVPTLIDLGSLLIDLGELPTATLCLRQATAADPANAEAWHHLSLAHFTAGQYDKGIAACRRALGLRPKRLATLHNLAVAWDRVQRPRRARAIARRALRLAPTDPSTRNLSRWLGLRRLLALVSLSLPAGTVRPGREV